MAFYNDVNELRTNIVISFTPDPQMDFGPFAKGYHVAATQLAERILERGKCSDCDGYPIVFLYRHALELNLKNIIYWTAKLAFFNMRPVGWKLYNTHDLATLAGVAGKALTRLFPEDKSVSYFVKKLIRLCSEFNGVNVKSCGKLLSGRPRP